jgi:hypothetical protein
VGERNAYLKGAAATPPIASHAHPAAVHFNERAHKAQANA